MSTRHSNSRAARQRRHLIIVTTLVALMALAFSYLGGVVAAQGPAPEPAATADPVSTPTADESTPPAPTVAPGDEMPEEVRAALEAFLAATGDSSLAAAADLPQAVPDSLSRIFLPQIVRERELGGGPPTVTPTTPTTVPTDPTVEPEPETADVAVRLWPDPNIRVIRGGTFYYDIRVRNHGEGSAHETKVTLPLRGDQYALLDAVLDRGAGDWVSSRDDRSVTITFGRLASGKERTGRLIFRAASNLPNDTVLDMRATYRWSDDGDGARDRKSNWAPLLVGQGNASANWVWAQISPTTAPYWTTFRVVSNRFIPGERVVTWLNLPDGKTRPLSLSGEVDALGNLGLNFQDTSLPAGRYQIVLYGQRSNLTGVAEFFIQR